MNTAIILFVYNRPLHTELVIEGLKKNNIKELFVFSDGAKSEVDIDLVTETRQLIDQINWCNVTKFFCRFCCCQSNISKLFCCWINV